MQDDIQWTDEELAAAYRTRIALAGNAEERPYRVAQHKADAEVYRLARIGLAAEQVGREVFMFLDTAELLEKGYERFQSFLYHEAWPSE